MQLRSHSVMWSGWIDFWCRYIEERLEQSGSAHRSRHLHFQACLLRKAGTAAIFARGSFERCHKVESDSEKGKFSKDYVLIPICESD